MRRLVLALFLACAPMLASPPGARAQDAYQPLTPRCLRVATTLEGISPLVVFGLIKTEGGKLGLDSVNRNGSHDLGLMQINDRTWLPRLADANFGGDRALTYRTLRDNGCYNVLIGTWIFKQYLDEAGGNYSTAIGWYNSHSEGPMHAYQRRFYGKFVELVQSLGGLGNLGLASR